MDTILGLIDSLLFFVWLGLFIRVILSWVIVLGGRNDIVWRLNSAVTSLTEPIIAPIRRVLPRTGAFDFSVLAAFVIIFIIRRAIASI